MSEPTQPGDPVAPVLRELLEKHTEGIVLFDSEFRIVFANSAARRISRLKDSDIGRTQWEVYPQVLGTSLEETYRRVQRTRIAESVPDFYFPPLEIWFRLRAVPVGEGLALYYKDVSDEHRISEEASRVEDRFVFALQAANGVGAWEWDVVNDLCYADANFAKLYGVDPELARQGTPVGDYVRNVHPDDAERLASEMQHAVQTQGNFVSEYRLLQPDGSIRWVATSGRVVSDDQGKPVRFPGVAVDITSQREQAEQLRLSEERYRLLTEFSPISKWTADAEGRVLYANHRFLEYLGREISNETGEEYLQCFDPEDRLRVYEHWSRCVLTGEAYSMDARLLRGADGASRWWHLEALPLRNDEGVIEQWIGSALDVHESRTAAAELAFQYEETARRSRELEAIYSGSPIGMALYEPKELRLTRINDRQAEIFGRSVEDCVGRTFQELTAGVPQSLPLIERAVAGHAVLNQEISGRLESGNGEVHIWNLNYTPIVDVSGNVSAVASATIELTAQKRAEAALVQAEKLAAVGRLASSIAHEINNPLEAVTNLIYLARSQAILPDVKHFLDLAEAELRRVAVIANGTLRFHKQSTRPTEAAAEGLFDSVMTLHEGRLRNSGVTVKRRPRATRTVLCFEGDIRQVLNNLVGNAIDAMPHGGRLLLRSREATDWRTGRRGIVVTVADTGSGMPENVRQHIFEAFYTTKGDSGTGLGLWISRDIVERHHGRLCVRSSRNPAHHGTVFTLFLPFRFEGSGSRPSTGPDS